MTTRFMSRLKALAKGGGGFTSYMAHLEGPCLGGKLRACDGGPTAHDAHRDYQAMLDSRHFTG